MKKKHKFFYYFVFAVFIFIFYNVHSSDVYADVYCCVNDKYCQQSGNFTVYSYECCTSSPDGCFYRRYNYYADYDYQYVSSCPTLYTDCFPMNQAATYQNRAGYGVTRRVNRYERQTCWDVDGDGYAICPRMIMWRRNLLFQNVSCSSSMCNQDFCN